MAAKTQSAKRPSAFAESSLKEAVRTICDEIRELYQWDAIPWVIGYSGGKDSTAVLQLVWLALQELPPEKRTKPVHVISTDTLVEQPIVARWVEPEQIVDTSTLDALEREGFFQALAAKSPADGYTLMMNSLPFLVNPLMYKAGCMVSDLLI